MKTIFILTFFLASTFVSNAAPSKDTAQVKMEQMEKLIKELQTEIKTLKSTDSTLTVELNTLRQSLPAARQKKLVIDRRGSKQSSFQ